MGCPTQKFALANSCKNFSFLDPHQGKGGFGASGAQFLSAYLQTCETQYPDTFPWQALAEYKKFDSNASGTDVLVQAASLTVREKRNSAVLVITKIQDQFLRCEPLPCLDLSVSIFKTGKKIPTHEHLREIAQQDFSELEQWGEKAFLAFEKKNKGDFLHAVKAFANTLESRNFVAEHTKEILSSFPAELGLAKGCGALGADAIAVFHDCAPELLNDWGSRNHLEVVGCWKI